jgi:hypothetical protein
MTSPRAALSPDQTVLAFFLDVALAVLSLVGRAKGD